MKTSTSLKEKIHVLRSTHGTLSQSIFYQMAKRTFKELEMNFQEMIKSLREGAKAYRPTWGEGEFLWQEGNVLVHNKPYWEGEVFNAKINSYPYVVEIEDLAAIDWIIYEKEAQ